MPGRKRQLRADRQQQQAAQPPFFQPVQHHGQHRHKEDHRQNQIAVQIRSLYEYKAEQIDEERRRGILHHPPARPFAFIFRVQPRVNATRRNHAKHEHRGDQQVGCALRRKQRHPAPPADELEEIREDRPKRLPHRRTVQRVEHERSRPADAADKQPRIDRFRHGITQHAQRKTRQRHAQKTRVRVAQRAPA